MQIKAKVKGELNLPANGLHWIHEANDERDFSDDLAKKILTNSNYEMINSIAKTSATEKTEKIKEIKGGKN